MALALGAGCAVGGFIPVSPWPLLGAAAALALALSRRSIVLLWAALFCL
ncbi:MAG: hypothetical protein GXO72_03435, partial [Caldiserica bacterium]|nr:hypothetical protein [Caldisericota bacterium]